MMHTLLSPGNLKLGRSGLIWSFGLPAGRPDICVGMSPACGEACHARQIERLRPAVLHSYERNYEFSQTKEFVDTIIGFIGLNQIGIVRIHVGGDFYSPIYTRRWLRIMRRLSDVRFFAYTRSWRDPTILPILKEMATLTNCRLWFSADQQTGIPDDVPERVRVAWLMTHADETPTGDLVFRVRRLRGRPARRLNLVLVCPTENGPGQRTTDCSRCGICWR